MFRRKYVKEYHTDIRSVTDKKYTFYNRLHLALQHHRHNFMGDSTDYTDFMISYHQMYLGMEAFRRRYNDMCEENSYFWKIKCSGIIKQVRIKMGLFRYIM